MKLQKTKRHQLYEQALRDKLMFPVIAHGSAGSGKTYTAVEFAVEWLGRGKSQKVVVIRPNESFCKSLGFLKGSMREKLDPWVQSVEKCFVEVGVPKTKLALMEKRGQLEYVALEFIQGLSFHNTLVIVDEAEDVDFKSLKMLLTRMGRYSKLVLCGDTAQTASKVNSGLDELINMVEYLNLDCHTIRFTPDDILRSEQCKHWLLAFDKWEGEGND